MGNLIDYVKKELHRFDEKPFNAVDSLVLSQFIYIHFDDILADLQKHSKKIRIGDMLKAEYFERMLNDVRANVNNQQLLFAIAASPRFRDIIMQNYVNHSDVVQEKQFCAVTYVLDEQTCYVAYRGTDSTIVGWKEDFNMSFTMPVPSQVEAARYLLEIAKKQSGQLLTGGHSKGGNLAVYAAMKAPAAVKQRLAGVYSHDGPGFQREVFASSEYQDIAELIHKTIPQSSMVGMLLEYQDNYMIVKSNEFWFMQHDPFSWQINQGDFIYQKHLSDTARYTNATINQWLMSVTPAERERFIDTLYNVIKTTNAKTVNELGDNLMQDGKAMITALNDVDDETKKFVFQTIKELASLSFRNLMPPKRLANRKAV